MSPNQRKAISKVFSYHQNYPFHWYTAVAKDDLIALKQLHEDGYLEQQVVSKPTPGWRYLLGWLWIRIAGGIVYRFRLDERGLKAYAKWQQL